MEISHPTTIRVGNKDYDYNIISVTKIYGGAKVYNDGTNIYLEDENGKVETMGIDFKPDIPPSTRMISTLWGEDKKTKKTFRFGYYIHSNDFLGYTTNQQSINAAKRIIPLQGFAAKLEKWSTLIIGMLAILFAWNAFWAGAGISHYGILSFFTAIPYVLLDTPYLIANFSDVAHSNSVSYGWAFLGLIVGFVIGKLTIGLTVGRLRSKLRLAFGGSLEEQLPKIFAKANQAVAATPSSENTSAEPKTDADGYQTLI